MNNDTISFPDFPNNTPEHHLVEEMKGLNRTVFHSLVSLTPTIDRINTTMLAYTKSTERLSKNTFWLNVVIAISALI